MLYGGVFPVTNPTQRPPRGHDGHEAALAPLRRAPGTAAIHGKEEYPVLHCICVVTVFGNADEYEAGPHA